MYIRVVCIKTYNMFKNLHLEPIYNILYLSQQPVMDTIYLTVLCICIPDPSARVPVVKYLFGPAPCFYSGMVPNLQFEHTRNVHVYHVRCVWIMNMMTISSSSRLTRLRVSRDFYVQIAFLKKVLFFSLSGRLIC